MLSSPSPLFALVESRGGALRLAALSPAAAHAGLAEGITLAEARAAVPALVTQPRDPQADLALLRRLARHAGRYTPVVTAEPPATLLLDITGCAHLFGGEEALTARLASELGAEGLTVSAARAATPDAARALAYHGARHPADASSGDVGALPVALLAPDETTAIALRRAGLRRVSDVAALPRAPLAARFGPELARRLARMLGEETAPLDALAAPAPLRVTRRFAEPVARVADVLGAATELAGELAGELARRALGGRVFTLALARSDGHVARLSVVTSAPTRDPALVMRLFAERIEALADPLDPGFGYDAIRLDVPRHEALDATQARLTPGREERAAPLAPLLDRLAARHGAERVLHFTAADSHIPERAGHLIPLDAQPGTIAGAATFPIPEPGEPPERPLLLLDPPQRLEVLASVPDGPPRRFGWRGRTIRVVRAEGPERIAPEWWRRLGGHLAEPALAGAGSPGLSRDYYRVEDEAGQRFWLFRHGLYGRESEAPRWYLHGLFA